MLILVLGSEMSSPQSVHHIVNTHISNYVCLSQVFLAFFGFHFAKFLTSPNYYKRPPNFSHYCIFFAGYKQSSTATKIFGFIFILVHFLIGLTLGLLHFNAFAQIIIILLLAVALFIYTIAVRPFYYCIHLIVEIVTQLLLIIALIGLTIAIFYERAGCFSCGGREGSLCYLIMLSLFMYLMLLALGLILFALLAGCFCNKALDVGKKKDDPEIKGAEYEDVHFANGQYDATNAMAGAGLMGAGAGMMGQGLNRSEHFVNTQTQHTNLINQEEDIRHDDFQDINRVEIIEENNSEVKQTNLINRELNGDSYENTQFDLEEEHREVRRIRKDNAEMEHIYGKDWEYQKEYKYGQNRHGRYSDEGALDKTMTVHPDSDDDPITQIRVLEALNVSDNAGNLENDHEELIKIRKNNEREKMAFERDFTDDESRYQANLQQMNLAHENNRVNNFRQNHFEDNMHDNDNFDNTNFNNNRNDNYTRREVTTTTYKVDQNYDVDREDVKYGDRFQHIQNDDFNNLKRGGHGYLGDDDYDSISQNEKTKNVDLVEMGEQSGTKGYFKDTNVKTTRVHSEAVQEKY